MIVICRGVGGGCQDLGTLEGAPRAIPSTHPLALSGQRLLG